MQAGRPPLRATKRKVRRGRILFFQKKPSLSFKKLELEEEEEEHGRMDGVRVGSGLTGESPKKLPLFPRLRNFSPLLLFCLHSEPRLIRLAEKPLSLILRPSLLFLSIFLSPLPRPSAAGSFPLHPGKELLELLTRNEVQQRTTTVFFTPPPFSIPVSGWKAGKKSGGDGRLRSEGWTSLLRP